MAEFPSFLWLNNILLYISHHIFFIHSSFDRHLGYHILTIVVFQWTLECRYQFKILIIFPSNIYPGVGLLGYMIILFLIFEEPPYCFAQWLHQITISSKVYDSLSSPLHQHLALIFLIINIQTGVKFYLIMDLICISLIISDIEHLFMCMGRLYVLLGKIPIHVLWSVFCFLISFQMGYLVVGIQY